ncbi:nucleoside diphosphate kinase homolog 5 [Exaiptasia diaphana]|uniref:Nucleoside diphosphate kinase homolog 5 n=1 Tax=Exaiptasia diaphana TaxID=2652724 RepID=A0A913WTJ3_EXADI|nr:nucleoside diphosphate kinase homolog 5 [Exaiptasia diaphana]KXJ18056.1 Nucleoside diphosphate kinase-like 5 [Exaiptasia diaphana]
MVPEEKPEPTPAKGIYVERTLAIIKPDAVHKTDEIEEIILQHGFTILQKRRVHLTPEQTSDFYAEHYGKMFFPSLVAYMSSGPIMVLVLARENAVPFWKQLIGPTSTQKARDQAPESLRAIYGSDGTRNALHGSDSITSAEREIHFFFDDCIVEPVSTGQGAKDYLSRTVNPTLLKGLTELSKMKPQEPILWLADWLVANNPNKPRVCDDDYTVEEP